MRLEKMLTSELDKELAEAAAAAEEGAVDGAEGDCDNAETGRGPRDDEMPLSRLAAAGQRAVVSGLFMLEAAASDGDIATEEDAAVGEAFVAAVDAVGSGAVAGVFSATDADADVEAAVCEASGCCC